MQFLRKHVLYLAFMPVFALSLMGCPRPDTAGNARIVTLFSTDTTPIKSLVVSLLEGKQGPVDVEEILSLTVTVTQMSLIHEAEGDAGEVVFDGAVDVDLMNLVGISEVLSEAEVPSGTYERIVLNISEPRLVLVDDPETVIEDVQLTANGRLFLNTTFTLPAEQTSLVLLDFGGIHLVERGSGGFNLTPQLRAEISVSNAAVSLEGEIVSVDLENDLVVIALETGELEVAYTDAALYLALDEDPPTGVEADLQVQVRVRVEGLIQVDGSVVATAVYLLL